MSPVLTLRELEAWSRPGVSLAVLGHPIRHSISPPMHNAALADLARTDARFADWEYFRFEVPAADLSAALRLLHAKRFRGVNLTVPHKVLAFDQVAAVAPAARPVGAVNTLLWTDAGWHGHNTDGYGLAAALQATLACDLRGAHVILLRQLLPWRNNMIDLASAWPYVKFVACERLKHNKTPRHVSQFGEAI